jgi:hypothetical protein|tara:strand:+ start:310 stop:447 length:138 start_codon:yes stop_codon:yes gene_type:complete
VVKQAIAAQHARQLKAVDVRIDAGLAMAVFVVALMCTVELAGERR